VRGIKQKKQKKPLRRKTRHDDERYRQREVEEAPLVRRVSEKRPYLPTANSVKKFTEEEMFEKSTHKRRKSLPQAAPAPLPNFGLVSSQDKTPRGGDMAKLGKKSTIGHIQSSLLGKWIHSPTYDAGTKS